MIDDLLNRVAQIAPHLPGGVNDPRSFEKLQAERGEFAETIAERDGLGAFTELADILYYVGKCLLNDLLGRPEAEQIIQEALASLDASGDGVDAGTALAILDAKYRVRVEGRKNDTEERQRVQDALTAVGRWG